MTFIRNSILEKARVSHFEGERYLVAALAVVDTLGLLLGGRCLRLLTLSLLLLLLVQLLDALLQHVGPEVTLKVWDHGSTGHIAFYGIFKDILKTNEDVHVLEAAYSCENYPFEKYH